VSTLARRRCKPNAGTSPTMSPGAPASGSRHSVGKKRSSRRKVHPHERSRSAGQRAAASRRLSRCVPQAPRGRRASFGVRPWRPGARQLAPCSPHMTWCGGARGSYKAGVGVRLSAPTNRSQSPSSCHLTWRRSLSHGRDGRLVKDHLRRMAVPHATGCLAALDDAGGAVTGPRVSCGAASGVRIGRGRHRGAPRV
jgi:hypothetical protein